MTCMKQLNYNIAVVRELYTIAIMNVKDTFDGQQQFCSSCRSHGDLWVAGTRGHQASSAVWLYILYGLYVLQNSIVRTAEQY